MSKLVHAAHTFPCPTDTTEKITKETINFIAGGKRTKVDSNILYLPVELGGLSLHDFNRRLQAQRLQWITELYNNKTTGSWKILMKYF